LKDLENAATLLGIKLAKEKAGKDRMTVTDVKKAKKTIGKRRGGVMKANSGKMANKDYDGDGRIESSTAEYMGSRDKAIKSKKLRGGGAAIRGNNFKGIY